MPILPRALALLGLWAAALGANGAAPMSEIAAVWSAHPVQFALHTAGDKQFAGYYNADRMMSVASRSLDTTQWTVQWLDEKTRWDSHGYIAMAADQEGYLHLCGNMHMSPLLYYRSEKPLDITTFKRRPSMTGSEEVSITYPKFLHELDGGLLFFYRHGRSGQGNEVLNRYTPRTQLWQRVNFRPITDGETVRNAYLDEFQRDAEGAWHVCWVWREEGDAATTNTLCHARTKDFRQWENVQGEKLKMPLTKDAPVVVDAVPPRSGMVNGNTKLALTPDGRPVIAYHKNDDKGTQIHVAGWDGDEWVVTPLTSYDYKWEFGGKGTLVGEIGVRRPRMDADGNISIQWTHAKFGRKRRLVNAKTFAAGEEAPPLSDGIPQELRKVESTFPEMTARFAWDSGDDGDPANAWLMRWETLPQNRDEPRPQPWPDPSILRVYQVPEPEVRD